MENNHAMIQFFEWNVPSDGEHWKRLSRELPKLNNLGITGVWIPPCTKALYKDDVGYATYDLWDLGEFDQKGSVRTKYGTKEELQEAMKVAKDLQVQVYADVVLNHKMGADEQEEFQAVEIDRNDRNHEVSGPQNIKAWTKFTFPGRKGKYSAFEWNHQHFSGTDYNEAQQKTSLYRIQGKRWACHVDNEFNNFDFLMGSNIDYFHPDVQEEVKRWATWIIKELGLSGFRFDALKHIEAEFIHHLLEYISKEVDNPNFFAVGEYWNGNMNRLIEYLQFMNHEDHFKMSLFDVPLHFNFKEAADKGKDYDMRKIFDGTLVKAWPIHAVTFVDNHDSQPGEALESWVQDWFKPLAYAIILLRADGYPCVFYGDYYGIGEPNPYPGRWDVITKLLTARRDYAYGQQDDYFDHPNTIGWVRRGDPNAENELHRKGCAVVICNSESGPKRMFVGEEKKGQVWVDLLGWVQQTVTIGEDGWAEFRAHSGSVSVWANAPQPIELPVGEEGPGAEVCASSSP